MKNNIAFGECNVTRERKTNRKNFPLDVSHTVRARAKWKGANNESFVRSESERLKTKWKEKKNVLFLFTFPVAMFRYNCFFAHWFQCVLFVFLRVNFFFDFVLPCHLRASPFTRKVTECKEQKIVWLYKYTASEQKKNRREKKHTQTKALLLQFFPASDVNEWFFCFYVCNFLFNSNEKKKAEMKNKNLHVLWMYIRRQNDWVRCNTHSEMPKKWRPKSWWWKKWQPDCVNW